MVRNVAELFRDLEPEDFYLLSGIEHGMRFSEWVREDRLPQFTGLAADEVDYRLDRTRKRDLIEGRTMQYDGYRLRFEGYDALALRAFVERDTIESIGVPLGVGKESDVYEVKSDEPLALKYHREGYTNFREVNREREYTADREHVSWLYTARKAAEREYERLSTLHPTVAVPRPIDHNRHAIVMEKMPGIELSRVGLTPEQVLGVIDLILAEIAAAYDAGYVHADLSEYNVFVSEDGVTIFDWPQAVPTDHPNAVDLLERDIRNLLGYFRRKHPNRVGDVSPSTLGRRIADGEFETVEVLG